GGGGGGVTGPVSPPQPDRTTEIAIPTRIIRPVMSALVECPGFSHSDAHRLVSPCRAKRSVSSVGGRRRAEIGRPAHRRVWSARSGPAVTSGRLRAETGSLLSQRTRRLDARVPGNGTPAVLRGSSHILH